MIVSRRPSPLIFLGVAAALLSAQVSQAETFQISCQATDKFYHPYIFEIDDSNHSVKDLTDLGSTVSQGATIDAEFIEFEEWSIGSDMSFWYKHNVNRYTGEWFVITADYDENGKLKHSDLSPSSFTGSCHKTEVTKAF
ncbi:hypothetical protein [Rhizobium ruizarguesonis]|jgi:hypothetical protein|uniref:hypothetical protein n=1 Tax=Rhizobium ruizarguesonis TaxID=2081791 RepID=UPI0010307700|nr:hypothetical protein [Rhizobium ruizarguesonis]TBA80345.1 hypothetical protein ELH56_08900 [Rhizobium ruizarguesonis]